MHLIYWDNAFGLLSLRLAESNDLRDRDIILLLLELNQRKLKKFKQKSDRNVEDLIIELNCFGLKITNHD
ncbi:hypothetical protein I4641_19640 [Waterburya agarophytonicola K14]|uniref:Uncharacterized protein n=1 Tax=Waterburya agarophytonicola KI4 TaxID=2874699 RepID=A0A964BV27_9CYAN|nr:hypothetical protein [Waterburya agarophytonicola]MCC0179182.1 hypothetical protein [Waterburya agarophytonicola KI4]